MLVRLVLRESVLKLDALVVAVAELFRALGKDEAVLHELLLANRGVPARVEALGKGGLGMLLRVGRGFLLGRPRCESDLLKERIVVEDVHLE